MLLFCLSSGVRLRAQTPAQSNEVIQVAATNNLLVMIQGTVEVARAGTKAWAAGALNQILFPGDRVQTGERSRAEVYLIGGMTIKSSELSEVEIPPSASVNFKKGIFDIFHRDRNRSTEYNLPGATAAIRGTDFLVKVSESGATELTVIDGLVTLKKGTGEVTVGNHEVAMVAPGGALSKTAMIGPINELIQWSLYYPAVVDTDELELSALEKLEFSDSLAAYQAGDLLQAVALFPWETNTSSDAVANYRVALWLSVGRTENLEQAMNALKDAATARALRKMYAVTKGAKWDSIVAPTSASEWLAESYARQAKNQLKGALEAARLAVDKSPRFGFAKERVAELEFSSGRVNQALEILEQSLAISPRNAQALALNGFLLAAQNRIPEAQVWFEKSIRVDSALGNAWLGRGLCRIRQGHPDQGLRDLLVAASLEPQRSVLRSYLGKGFANAGDDAHAEKELLLACQLDANDPTAWLYSALLKQQENRVNEAVEEIQASQQRNDNRSLFRSRLLLDEDRAVGSANLASIYRDAGMTEVSVNEAVRAVNDDYANYSAHLFLANSLNELRDPTRFNLRYETAWFNELLLANLYAPAGSRPISQNISQQEYSRLFEGDRLGFYSFSEYRSDGKFHEVASQYGSKGRASYSLDLDYQHNEGIRPNNQLNSIEWYSQMKYQASPFDTLLLITKYQDYHSGDNFQYFNQTNASANFQYFEHQTPLLVGAYHHEWGPGIHTLFLAGHLPTDQQISDKAGSYYLVPQIGGVNYYNRQDSTDPFYSSRFGIYTSELNQLIQSDSQTVILGTRFQFGRFKTSDTLTPVGGLFPPVTSSINERFQRFSVYGYYEWEAFRGFHLTAGGTYDRMTYPDNFRFAPVSSGVAHREQISPKAGINWTINSAITFRAAYARALGGVTLDESFTLEPTQIGGFNQAFRSIISESLVGSLAGPSYDVLGTALEIKLRQQTYLTLEAQYLKSHSDESIGVIYQPDPLGQPSLYSPGTVPEELRYREPSASLTLNQLWGRDFAMGAQYKYTDSTLEWFYPTLTAFGAQPSLNQKERAGLHQVNAYFQFTHPSGIYARAEVRAFFQRNSGSNPSAFDVPDSNSQFAQVNLLAGHRFWHRKLDFKFGILNVGGDDYRLSPLTPYGEQPRGRVFYGGATLDL